METGGRNRPPAEKTLENPVRVPKVQGSFSTESLRQKDGDIQKGLTTFFLPLLFRASVFSTEARFCFKEEKENARGNLKHRSKG